MKSIIQQDKECWFCGNQRYLHEHHIFFGTANRKQSEKYGMKVWLCPLHHTSEYGVHHDRLLDLSLKQKAQKVFEELYSRERFMEVFGKNYRED